MIRVRAAAAPGNVEQPFICEGPEDRAHLLRGLFVTPQFIRQTGVGVGGDPAGGFAGEFGNVRLHLRCAQCAVEPDGKEIRRVHHRDEKRLHILPREQSAGCIGKRAGDHHRDRFAAPFLFEFGDGVDGGFGVEGVKNRFDEQHISPPVQQPRGSFMVGVCQFKKSQFPEGGIRYGRGHGKGLARGTDGSCDKPGLSRCEFREGIGGTAGNGGTGAVQLIHFLRQTVLRLRKTVGVECVGLDDVCSRLQIFCVDGENRSGLGQVENVVIARQVAGMIGKDRSPEILFGKVEGLKHGPHGTIQNEDAFCQGVGKRGSLFHQRKSLCILLIFVHSSLIYPEKAFFATEKMKWDLLFLSGKSILCRNRRKQNRKTA